MGDGTDMAIEHAWDDCEQYGSYEDAPQHIQYEEGLIDEMGGTIGNPHSVPFANNISKKVHGAGGCPLCGSHTVKRSGPYGAFYGCDKFPKCKGNRNL